MGLFFVPDSFELTFFLNQILCVQIFARAAKKRPPGQENSFEENSWMSKAVENLMTLLVAAEFRYYYNDDSTTSFMSITRIIGDLYRSPADPIKR